MCNLALNLSSQHQFLALNAPLSHLTLPEAVAEAFAAGGAVAKSLPAFNPRLGQQTMALQVAHTMADGGVLVVEAGTGIGKTYAYLVPALLSGQRVLLSTATKALQDQLYIRDIPCLMAALGVGVRLAVLKGRSSYLCTQRLDMAHQAAEALHPLHLPVLGMVEQWSRITHRGDLAELPALDEDSPVVALVTSTRDNCWGARCPQLSRCHVNQARRHAMDADVVVVNHHLFFADLHVRDSGVAELLPSVHTVVFDEAHQLNDIGVQFLASQCSTGQVLSLGRDMLATGNRLARGWVDWSGLHAALLQAVKNLQIACAVEGGHTSTSDRRPWADQAPVGVDAQCWESAMLQLQQAMYCVHAGLEMVAPAAPELQHLHTRAAQVLQWVLEFSQAPQPGKVRWIEAGATHIRFAESPLTIAQAMQTKVLAAADPQTVHKSWIFTSATLGHDAQLSWFVQTCGLPQAKVLKLPSPFNYAAQAALYLPPDMVTPDAATHSSAVAHLVAQSARVLGGRTLVLTTTLRAMRTIAEVLRQTLHPLNSLDVLVQGEMPKRSLLQRFGTSATGPGGRGMILVASVSFWEGIDLPGTALQLVVIDKIPFAPPDDPLVQARAQSVVAGGKNPFMHFHLPQAALALKQGAGRLIRNEADQGVLVVCDVRLLHKGYGRKLIAAMPPMRRLHTPEEFSQALADLTTTSTTDRC